MSLPVIPDGPFVFVSYSWKDNTHVKWVQGEVYNKLKQALKPDIHVVLDVNEEDMLNLQLNHGSIAAWMLDACSRAAVVIVVCSPGYKASTEITEGSSAVYCEYHRGILPRLLSPQSYVSLIYDNTQFSPTEVPSITPVALRRAFFALPFQAQGDTIVKLVKAAVAVQSGRASSASITNIPGSKPERQLPSPERLSLLDTAGVSLIALNYAAQRAEWCPERLSKVPLEAQVHISVEETKTGWWPWSSKDPKMITKEYIAENVVTAVRDAPRSRIILLGDPAAGKSTAMRELARELLQPWILPRDKGGVDEMSPGETVFPVFVDLGGLPSKGVRLVDYIKESAVPAGLSDTAILGTLASLVDPPEKLPENFPHIVILLDSFDEAAAVRNHQAQSLLMNEITKFCDNLDARLHRHKWTVVVAMRKRFQPHDPKRKWARYTLIDLNGKRQRQKIQANLEPEHHRDDLLTELAINPDLQQRAGNPLMLDLIMRYWRSLDPSDRPQPGHLQMHDVLGEYWRSQSTEHRCIRPHTDECVLLKLFDSHAMSVELQRLADVLAFVLTCTEDWTVRAVYRHVQTLSQYLDGMDSDIYTDRHVYLHALEHLHEMSIVTVGPMWSVTPYQTGDLASLVDDVNVVPIRFVHRQILEYFAANFYLRYLKTLEGSQKDIGMGLAKLSTQSREVLIPAMQIKPLSELEPVVAPFVAILKRVEKETIHGFARGQEPDGPTETEVYHAIDLISGGFRGRRKIAQENDEEVFREMLVHYDRVLNIILLQTDKAVLLHRRYLRFAAFFSRDIPLSDPTETMTGLPEHLSPCIGTLLKYLHHPVSRLRFEAFDTISSLGRLSKAEGAAFEATVPGTLILLHQDGQLHRERHNIKLRLRSIFGARDLTAWVDYLSYRRVYDAFASLPRHLVLYLLPRLALALGWEETWPLSRVSTAETGISMVVTKMVLTLSLSVLAGNYSTVFADQRAHTIDWMWVWMSLPIVYSGYPLYATATAKDIPELLDIPVQYLSFSESALDGTLPSLGQHRALGIAFMVRHHATIVRPCQLLSRTATYLLTPLPQNAGLLTTVRTNARGLVHKALSHKDFYSLSFTMVGLPLASYGVFQITAPLFVRLSRVAHSLMPFDTTSLSYCALTTLYISSIGKVISDELRETSSLSPLDDKFEREEAGQGVLLETLRVMFALESSIRGHFVHFISPRRRRHRRCLDRLANGKSKLHPDIDRTALRAWYENDISDKHRQRMMTVVEAYLASPLVSSDTETRVDNCITG